MQRPAAGSSPTEDACSRVDPWDAEAAAALAEDCAPRRARPARPTHAAVNGFIAAHAAAFAAGDVTAAPRERAAQARWLARRLSLESG
jgi:hypothetical protein